MKKNKIIRILVHNILLIIILLFASDIYSQSNPDNILQSVSANNPSIKANEEFASMKKAEYKTGLNPENPVVEYGYFPGNSSAIGTKEVFGISQSFDFLLAYFKRKELSKLQSQGVDYQQNAIRQEVLLEAKKLYLDLVHYNKEKGKFEKRKKDAELLYNSYKKQLDAGDVGILDLNKIKLQLLGINNDLKSVEAMIDQLHEELKQLNGGEAIMVSDTIYPIVQLKSKDEILNALAEKDPVLKSLQNEKDCATGKHKLQKASNLPAFEVGYESETVLNDTYRGFKFGITIPLWANANTLKHTKASINYADQKFIKYSSFINSDISRKYIEAENLKNSLELYNEALKSTNNAALLKKALRLGQISLIEYLRELEYFYDVKDKHLELERDYYMAVAELYRFEL